MGVTVGRSNKGGTAGRAWSTSVPFGGGGFLCSLVDDGVPWGTAAATRST